MLFTVSFQTHCKNEKQVIFINLVGSCRGRPSGWAIVPPQTYESIYIHHYFVHFRKQHSL